MAIDRWFIQAQSIPKQKDSGRENRMGAAMSMNRISWLAIFSELVLSVRLAPAQGGPTSGLYQIVSGRYTACCGIAGPFIYPLPDSSQAFVQLTIDPQSNLAQMTILGQDARTVFHIPPIGFGSGFAFSLSNGIVFPDHIQFGAPFLPPGPDQPAFSYRLSNSADALRISGTLTLPCPGCADIPTEFEHTNVVAALLPPAPVIEGLERGAALLRFRFTGVPAYDYFVEFTDSLPASNWLSLTNFRAKLQTIEAMVTDPLTNGPARFYRVRRQDCLCD